MAATGGAAGYDSLGVARTVIVTLTGKRLQLQQRPLMFEAVMEQVGWLVVCLRFGLFLRFQAFAVCAAAAAATDFDSRGCAGGLIVFVPVLWVSSLRLAMCARGAAAAAAAIDL
jgi:hypothetical protein